MSLIKNYGLFWRRDWIFWGKQNNEGHLWGRSSKNLKGKNVDFSEQQGVYVLYDETFRIVYIGQTGKGKGQKNRLRRRLRQHISDGLADRWNRFSWFGIRRVIKDGKLAAENQQEHPTVETVLNHVEAVLISAAEPPHNRQGGRFGSDVKQYIQRRDEEGLGPDLEEMVKEVLKRVSKQ